MPRAVDHSCSHAHERHHIDEPAAAEVKPKVDTDDGETQADATSDKRSAEQLCAVHQLSIRLIRAPAARSSA